jgi:hypothetical protein
MVEFISDYALELICTLITTATLGYAKHLHSQKKRFEQILQEDQNRRYRQMILDEIDPIVEELRRLNDKVTSAVADLRAEATNAHTQMYQDLEQVTKRNDKNLELIINSYKFRLIQLCKTHLRDGWISQDDFDQVCEMYKLYHGLGGNGQAHDYYERVMKLPVGESPSHSRREEGEK